MSASTTLKLPEELKERIASLAKSVGKMPHAWMVDALEAQAAVAEKRNALVANAFASRQVEETDSVYRGEDVHRYIRARAAGRKLKRPKPVKW